MHLAPKLIRKIVRPRKADSHKGDHGHALLIAGNKGRMGAAVIAAKACLRTGPGLLTVNVPQDERHVLQVAIPEAMLLMREEDYDLHAFSAIGIGSAMGTDEKAERVLEKVFSEWRGPLVIDADALTVVSSHTDLFENLPTGAILTPHPKEFDRLFGKHTDEAARRKTAMQEAGEKNIIIVLKGHHTFITSGGMSFENSTGNAGLAKGGTGDALTGIITAFAAQGYAPIDAATAGVYIHGLAAELALKDQSMESMLITDVIDCLGKAFKKIIKNK